MAFGWGFMGLFSLPFLDVFLRCLGPLFFVSIIILIVLVRITTPRMRVETMARLGWQPLFWLLKVIFIFYFLGWFLA
jgi:hypothetical protein